MCRTAARPQLLVVNFCFRHVGEGYNVACVRRSCRLIGYPHFDAVNLHATHDVRQVAHVLIIAVAEVMGEEEVAVFVVVVDINFKVRKLCAALRTYGCCG